MAELVGIEILELADGESKQITVVNWELGEMIITPRAGGGPKRIRALRLFVPPADKTLGPAYWDVTGQTLIVQLLPFLDIIGFRQARFVITKHGVAPTARFTLQVLPDR